VFQFSHCNDLIIIIMIVVIIIVIYYDRDREDIYTIFIPVLESSSSLPVGEWEVERMRR